MRLTQLPLITRRPAPAKPKYALGRLAPAIIWPGHKKQYIMILAVLFFPGVAAATTTLPPPVEKLLETAQIPLTAVTVVIRNKDTVFLNHNGTQAFNPASLMKLLTTYAALSTLGPNYTWHTDFLSASLPDHGSLRSPLYIRGQGDPKLTLDRFLLALQRLRNQGIKRLNNIVIDSTYFDIPSNEPSFDEDVFNPYNVEPNALLLNFNSINLTLPETGHKVSIEPAPSNLSISNGIKPIHTVCGEWETGLNTNIVKTGKKIRLMLSGHYPTSCGMKHWNLSLMSHQEYFSGVFQQYWKSLGGTLTGNILPGKTPDNAQILLSTESATLLEMIRDINKFSNNVMARQLFLSLGKTQANEAKTLDMAKHTVQDLLTNKGLNFPELILENGSGLSRQERLSAASLATLLAVAATEPLGSEYISSLPIVALDGTMRKRLLGRSVAGTAHIKTGTLDGVKGIAGYVQKPGGENSVVVFMVNHPNAAHATAAMDTLLEWVYETAPAAWGTSNITE